MTRLDLSEMTRRSENKYFHVCLITKKRRKERKNLYIYAHTNMVIYVFNKRDTYTNIYFFVYFSFSQIHK